MLRRVFVVALLVGLSACAGLSARFASLGARHHAPTQIVTVTPPPFGGSQRTVVITLDPDKLRQYHIAPEEAIAAVNKSTLVMPSRNMWTGQIARIARTNASQIRE